MKIYNHQINIFPINLQKTIKKPYINQQMYDSVSFTGKTKKQDDINNTINWDCITDNNVRDIIKKLINNNGAKPNLTKDNFIRVINYFGYVEDRQSGSHKIYKNDCGHTYVVPGSEKDMDPNAIEELMDALSHLNNANGELIFKGKSSEEDIKTKQESTKESKENKKNKYRIELEKNNKETQTTSKTIPKETKTVNDISLLALKKYIETKKEEISKIYNYANKNIEELIQKAQDELENEEIAEKIQKLKENLSNIKQIENEIQSNNENLSNEDPYIEINNKANEAKQKAEALSSDIESSIIEIYDLIEEFKAEKELKAQNQVALLNAINTITQEIPKITDEDKEIIKNIIQTESANVNLSQISENDLLLIMQTVQNSQKFIEILNKYKSPKTTNNTEEIEKSKTPKTIVEKQDTFEDLIKEYQNSLFLQQSFDIIIQKFSQKFSISDTTNLKNRYIALFTKEELTQTDVYKDNKILIQKANELKENLIKEKKEKERQIIQAKALARIEHQKQIQNAIKRNERLIHDMQYPSSTSKELRKHKEFQNEKGGYSAEQSAKFLKEVEENKEKKSLSELITLLEDI